MRRVKVNVLCPQAKSDRLAGCNRRIGSGGFDNASAHVNPNALAIDRRDPAFKQILDAEKPRDREACRVIEHLGRAAVLPDRAGFNDRDLVREGACLSVVVRHEYRRKPGFAKKAREIVAQRERGRGVQRSERFIEQEEIGSAGERTRQGRALLFTGAQIGGPRRGKMRDAEALERRANIDMIAARAAAKFDVLRDREMREQAEILHHESDASLLGWQRRDIAPGDMNPAARHPMKAGDRFEADRFPRAVRPEQYERRAGFDRNAHAAERKRAELQREILGCEPGAAHLPAPAMVVP
ncbi:MAG TPA: hypothetical protein VNF99_05255 [Stellaceae bacterium]|nr:hypothetical protein [Stellaceae bacterium]